ncbi:hypothetical protein EYF80_045920 [Liparis tanakae]|uniref:Uncharacterized protein n=1 Tax=Liparis tanakae TaxID=230148 RepID=A0A4Z2FRW9_9TELE|nr:hypothetical protein EYF80_045920 [Liparis tanakae]
MAAMLKSVDRAGALRGQDTLAQSFGLSSPPETCSLTGVHQMLQAAFTDPLHETQCPLGGGRLKDVTSSRLSVGVTLSLGGEVAPASKETLSAFSRRPYPQIDGFRAQPRPREGRSDCAEIRALPTAASESIRS